MSTTTELPTEEAERIAGILEDHHSGLHPTIEARALAEKVVDGFRQDTPGHWQLVASSLIDDPSVLDRFAAEHGLPRPTDAVKATAIAMVRSKGLAAGCDLIPAASERPVCVRVGWLAEDPLRMAHLEYLDANVEPAGEWRPASEAVDTIDHGWPVEIRQRMTVVGA